MPKRQWHRFTLEAAWCFDDHKGWDVKLGERTEGTINWWRADHEIAKDNGGEGFYWDARSLNPPHEGWMEGGPFKTLDECADDMWSHLFGGQSAET